MQLLDSITAAMATIANGWEDEDTGEIRAVDEIKITYGTKEKGDFEVVIRRPQPTRDSDHAE